MIRNGYDGSVIPSMQSTNGRLTILFAGELYVGRDPFPFLAALEWLLSRPEVDSTRIRVTFMGRVDSYADKSLTQWVAERACGRVMRLLPPQGSEVLAAAVEESTVLLNFAQGQHLSVPAKTYEHLASGREILVACENDCETARLVAGIPGVNQVDPSNFGALTEVLLSLYNRHVLIGKLICPAESDVERFSRPAANEAFLALFSAVT